MKAMILAAGLGTRLRPLTDTLPKALVPLQGRPLLEWNIRWLMKHGVDEIIVNGGRRGVLVEMATQDVVRLLEAKPAGICG